MGQKTNPIGLRLGIIKGWDSNWYGGKDYSDKLVEDERIRNYIKVRLAKGSISKIVIERTLKLITVTIHTSRPGIIIGKGGKEVDKLKEELKNVLNKEAAKRINVRSKIKDKDEAAKIAQRDVQINIFEIKRPELDARLVADSIARQIEGRISFRRAVKMSIASTMRMGAEGIKVRCSGRLAGAEIARMEAYKEGRTPLHTLRADIDYATAEAHTTYGRIGIKVWICKGEVYGKRDLSPNFVGSKEKKAPANNNPAFAGKNNNNGGKRKKD